MPHHRQVQDQSFDNLDLEGAVEMLANLTVTQREKRAQEPARSDSAISYPPSMLQDPRDDSYRADSPLGPIGNTVTNQLINPMSAGMRGVGVNPEVAKHLSYGLLGAGIGGVAGLGSELLSGKKKKRPLSALLQGGLLGGAAGGAGSLLYQHLPGVLGTSDKPDAGATATAAAAARNQAAADKPEEGSLEELVKGPTATNVGGGLMGVLSDLYKRNQIRALGLPLGADIAGQVAGATRYGRGVSSNPRDLEYLLSHGQKGGGLERIWDRLQDVRNDQGTPGLSTLMHGGTVTPTSPPVRADNSLLGHLVTLPDGTTGRVTANELGQLVRPIDSPLRVNPATLRAGATAGWQQRSRLNRLYETAMRPIGSAANLQFPVPEARPVFGPGGQTSISNLLNNAGRTGVRAANLGLRTPRIVGYGLPFLANEYLMHNRGIVPGSGEATNRAAATQGQ